MPACAPSPSLNQRAFVLEALQAGIRPSFTSSSSSSSFPFSTSTSISSSDPPASLKSKGSAPSDAATTKQATHVPQIRTLLSERPYDISFGEGCGDVRLVAGEILILAHTSATLTVPRPSHPSEGILTFTFDLSPQSDPTFATSTSGVSSAQALLEGVLSTHISGVLGSPPSSAGGSSAILPLDSLALVAGRTCWKVAVSVHIVKGISTALTSGAGAGRNLAAVQNAALAACTASLLHFRLPESEVRGEGGLRVFWPELGERVEGVPLGLIGCVGAVAVGWFPADSSSDDEEEQGGGLIFDPDPVEEDACGLVATVVANTSGEVLRVRAGGGALDARVLLGVITEAARRAGHVARHIQDTVTADWKARSIGRLPSI